MLKKSWPKKTSSIKQLQEATQELYGKHGNLKAEIKKLEGKIALAAIDQEVKKTSTQLKVTQNIIKKDV